MGITRGYTTLAEFQARTGQTDATITAKTTLIEREIERASRRIDQYTSSFFYTNTLTSSKVVYGFVSNSDGISMSEDATYISFPAPILTITSVINDGVAMVLNEDYYIDGSVLFANTIFTTNRKNGVLITGTCGYASTPDDINEACLALAEVSTGMGIRTVIDPAGDKLEVTRDSVPDWVWDSLDLRRRYDGVG